MNYGTVTLDIEEFVKKKNISKTKLSYQTEIPIYQLTKILKKEVTRLDFTTLAKLCTVLECDVSDILTFEKPNND